MAAWKYWLAAAWIACGVASAGITDAHSRARFANLHQSTYNVRVDLVFSIGFGIFGPVALFVAFMTTGGAYYGWGLYASPLPCMSKYPDIWCKT